MKKIIMSALSACVLCPTIACAETFDLVCTFDNEYVSLKKDVNQCGLEIGKNKIMKDKTIAEKYNVKAIGKYIKSWDAFGEHAVTSSVQKRI